VETLHRSRSDLRFGRAERTRAIYRSTLLIKVPLYALAGEFEEEHALFIDLRY